MREREERILLVLLLSVAQDFGIRSICGEKLSKGRRRVQKVGVAPRAQH